MVEVSQAANRLPVPVEVVAIAAQVAAWAHGPEAEVAQVAQVAAIAAQVAVVPVVASAAVAAVVVPEAAQVVLAAGREAGLVVVATASCPDGASAAFV